MYVLGTAGHVDHGKSTLVEVLTGIDPDRLREEQERQLTIDLGFAWMELPSGEEIGLVDVPGHRDFIENMLAGVGAIDAALFVVAADEGVMPQTREHLAILDLLEVERGVVVLTKIDLVEEAGWLDLVEEDVTGLLSRTRLAEAPIVRVSGRTGDGIDELRQTLDRILGDSEPRKDLGRPRLGVDRAFTVSGFGTVVTGTLLDGSLQVGDEVVVLPAGLPGRIRGLQTHKQDKERVVPGSRVAANLSGVDVDQVGRGDVVAYPDTYRPTDMMDAHVRVLELGGAEVGHDQEVKLFVGAAQRMARLRILGGPRELKPGESGWLQLILESPVVARRGDRYILRKPSPPMTISGGRVADPHPARRHRMKDARVTDRLEALLNGSTEQILLETLAASGPTRAAEVFERAGIESAEGRSSLRSLLEKGAVLKLADDLGEAWWVESGWLERTVKQLINALQEFHRGFPLRPGMPQEELRSRLGLGERVFQAVLHHAVEERTIQRGEGWVGKHDFQPSPTEQELERVRDVKDQFRATPYSPPNVKDVRAQLGDELYEFMRQRGELVQVSEDVVFDLEAYQSMVEGIESLIRERGPVRVADVRDHFDTSRKYVLGLLEHLDRRGVTVRQGDVRTLRGG